MEDMVMRTVYLPEDMDAALRAYARAQGVPAGQVIRQAVSDCLRDHREAQRLTPGKLVPFPAPQPEKPARELPRHPVLLPTKHLRLAAGALREWAAREAALPGDRSGDPAPPSGEDVLMVIAAAEELERAAALQATYAARPFDAPPPPITPALAAAADSLERRGNYHRWWGPEGSKWREADPIGREEFLAIVQGVVDAYLVAMAQARRAGPREEVAEGQQAG